MTNTHQNSGDELKFYELLEVLSGPVGWMADLERIIADKVGDAYGEGVVAGRVDEWLKLDKVVNFTKRRHPAVYKLQLPLTYVQTRTKELKALQQPNPQAGDGLQHPDFCQHRGCPNRRPRLQKYCLSHRGNV
jgi:hypothetical protein